MSCENLNARAVRCHEIQCRSCIAVNTKSANVLLLGGRPGLGGGAGDMPAKSTGTALPSSNLRDLLLSKDTAMATPGIHSRVLAPASSLEMHSRQDSQAGAHR